MNNKLSYEELELRITELEKEGKNFRRVEQVLRKREIKYRTLFEKSKDAILIINNRKFIDCNDATIEMLGYSSKSHFLETAPSELSPSKQPDGEDSFEKSQKMMDLAVSNGSHRFEWYHVKADGSVFPVEVILTMISSERDSEVIHTIWRDISEHKRVQEIVLESEERFRSLVETTSDVIWEVDLKNRYSYISPRIVDLLGYTPEEILGRTRFDLMLDAEKVRVVKIFKGISISKESFHTIENILLHKDGTQVVVETSGVPFFEDNNELAGYRGIDRDVTVRKGYEEQLILTESVFTNSIEGIVITDQNGIIQKVNSAFSEITGYSAKEAFGSNPRMLKSDRHDEEFYGQMWKSLIKEGQWSGEIWNRRKDGSAYPEWLSIAAIRNDKGKITNFISLFHDISEKKINEKKLELLAFRDPLTKLPNRRLFYDRLNVAIASAKRTNSKTALLYMDIDNFKDINDTHGHPFGDEVLCKVKERISSICRKSDTFARYGGDEFVIVLNQISGAQEAINFSDRLIRLFKEPLHVLGEEVFSSLSIGLALFPDNGEDIVTLEKNADMALYQAKEGGKRQAFLFRQDLHEKMQRKIFLENAMRRSIKDFSSFFIMYQPKVDSIKNKIQGVEALLRWKLDGTLISPVEFIPIAEETNTIVSLGKWVMRQAMADMKKIHNLGYDDISLSINLSTKQFKAEGLFGSIEEAIERTGFDRSKLYFEITESTPMEDVDKAVKIMEKFRDKGIKLSMDDFGTGYSSLSYLKKFPLKELKIDRSFIQDIPHDQNDIAITKTIINMANSLNYQVVAEGVETKEQLAFLNENGCYLIQGFLLYKPMIIDELISVVIKAHGFSS